MEDNLNVLHRGNLNFKVAWPILSASGEPHRQEVEAMLADPGGLFLNHVPSEEYFKGTGDRLDALAQLTGRERTGDRTFRDSSGRPEFVLYRFEARPLSAGNRTIKRW
jgi:hypothetical protein